MKTTKFFALLPVLIAGVFIFFFSSCSKKTVPSLSTKDASIVSDMLVKVGGIVTEDGGASIIESGVCYNISSNPSIDDNSIQSGMGTETFDCTLTGLKQGTKYYYNAYAINSAGIGYGDQKTFSIPEPCPGMPTITYAGQVYHTVQIGNQCWLKQNLNIGKMIMGDQDQTNNGQIEKYCYNNDSENCAIYGGLYQWAEIVKYLNGASNNSSWDPAPTGNVIGICPNGWHIPSDADWNILINQLGGNEVAGGKMKTATGWAPGWSRNGNGSNISGFTGLPTGGRFDGGNFSHLMSTGAIWLSPEYNNFSAWYGGLTYLSAYASLSHFSKDLGRGCRCVQD